MEAAPLQILTHSTVGSNDEIIVNMYNKGGNYIGAIRVKFTSPMSYYMTHCMGWCTDDCPLLPVQPPVEVEKIWTIEKTETAYIITCNNVKVLHYQFAYSSWRSCATNLAGADVEQIEFFEKDTASDYYKKGKGLNVVDTNYHI